MGKKSITIGDFIAVDYFVQKKNLKYFFLTHAHRECFAGLNRKWNFAPIYCSAETAKILPILTREIGANKAGISEEWLRPLSMNVPYNMEGFTVTLLDANHIVGGVMLLFEGPEIPEGPVLCTGDFRADSLFFSNSTAVSLIQQHIFGTIFLDNTHMELETEEFPSREESLRKAVSVIRQAEGYSKIFIVVNRVGREGFLIKLSQKLETKIGLHGVRQEIAKALGIHHHFAEKDADARIQTCHERQVWNMLYSDGAAADTSMEENCTFLEIGLHSSFKSEALASECCLQLVEYSDHSSPNEIRDFLSILKFRRLVGTAGNIPIVRRNELLALSLWRSNENEECPRSVQKDPGQEAMDNGEEIIVQSMDLNNFERRAAAVSKFATDFLRGVESYSDKLFKNYEIPDGEDDSDAKFQEVLSSISLEGEIDVKKITNEIASRMTLKDVKVDKMLGSPFDVALSKVGREKLGSYEKACETLSDWPAYDGKMPDGTVEFELPRNRFLLPDVHRKVLEKIRSTLTAGK